MGILHAEYFGHAAGAILTTDGHQPGAPLRVVCGSVQRPPEPRQQWRWMLFDPYPADHGGRLHGAAAESLRARLEHLADERDAARINLRQYRDAIDCAIADAVTRP